MKSIFHVIFFITLRGLKTEDVPFPPDFQFGVATSAYQIEGGWDADGKSISFWDNLCHRNPSPIIDGSNGDIACDSYHKYKEDVQLIKELGVDFYRFSLSWTRIIPGGFSTKINPAGVDYYNNLINELIENNIEPIITIYHWDLPQEISVLGGLANPDWVKYFSNYARIVYGLFGDRVKRWITFNEPNIICDYMNNAFAAVAAAYPSGVIEYSCTRNLLKAHAEAYHIYDKEFRKQQNGQVGITLNFEWAEPLTDKPEDIEAAERIRQFDFGIWLHPIIYYDYPQVVIDRVAERSRLQGYPESRLPPLSLPDKLKIRGSIDFLGLNHYTTSYAADIQDAPLEESSFYIDRKVESSHDPSWEETSYSLMWVVPWGLYSSLNWIKDTYGDIQILITECGNPDATGTLDDEKRIDFFKSYLNATREAIIRDSVNVIGFTAWSLLDNFEWSSGYLQKFGLYHVDFNDPDRKRTPKSSVEYWKSVTSTRKIGVD